MNLRTRGARRRPWTALVVLWLAAAAAVRPALAAIAPSPTAAAALPGREFVLRVSNVGHWAYGLEPGLPGLEFPRASAHDLAYSGGFWAGARVAGGVRVALAEFGSEFVPGPAPDGVSSRVGERDRVFVVTAGDTTGRAAWNAWAVPAGAPRAAAGDATLWSVCTDAGPLEPELPVRGQSLSERLGIEVRLTAWTFDRPGAPAGTAYLRWQVMNRGPRPLDSLTLGLFLDPLAAAGSPALLAADTTRDLMYAWRATAADPVYGTSGPALGVRVLQGPVRGRRALRPASLVVYPNGSDPADAAACWAVLRGRLPWGDAMFDSSAHAPARFWSPGDPVTGDEWVALGPPHGHGVLALEPFTLAPGDSAELVAALVVARGDDPLASVRTLRERADRALADWRDGFASLPPREVLPLHAGPNPAQGGVRLAWSVTGGPKPMRVEVYDLSGRRVRVLLDAVLGVGDHVRTWDGRDDAGRALPAGVYVVRVRQALREAHARVALLR